jgi:hypothetical protein
MASLALILEAGKPLFFYLVDSAIVYSFISLSINFGRILKTKVVGNFCLLKFNNSWW